MKRTYFSLTVALLASLLLALGILVADLTGSGVLSAAQAQSNTPSGFCSNIITLGGAAFGGTVVVSEAVVGGGGITARGVHINGEAVNGVFAGVVRIVNGTVVSNAQIIIESTSLSLTNLGGGQCANGVIASGEITSTRGVIESGETTPARGVIASGETTPAGGLTLTGGVVEGDNIQIKDGVITGDNLRIVGAVLSGDGIRVTGIGVVASPF